MDVQGGSGSEPGHPLFGRLPVYWATHVPCQTLQHLAGVFSIPLAADKSEAPATELVFLGITVDSVVMECRLPNNKFFALRLEVRQASSQHKITLKALQLLLGK